MKNEKILIPVLEENGFESRVSPHFGHAPLFALLGIEDDSLEFLKNDVDHHDPNKSAIEKIFEKYKPSIIFARQIGAKAIKEVDKIDGLCLKTGDYSNLLEIKNNKNHLKTLSESCSK